MELEYDIKCSYDKLVNLKTLKPNPRNPNKHTSEQLVLFATILKYQGIRRPVRISKRSKIMTAGHGLVEAFKINGWKKIPVDYQDYDDEAQEYADMVCDNELNRMSKTDYAMINENLPEFGPELTPIMLGLPDFKIEPMDKYKDGDNKSPDEGQGNAKENLVYSLKADNAIIVRDAVGHARKEIERIEGKPPTNGLCLLYICQKFMSYRKTTKTRKSAN